MHKSSRANVACISFLVTSTMYTARLVPPPLLGASRLAGEHRSAVFLPHLQYLHLFLPRRLIVDILSFVAVARLGSTPLTQAALGLSLVERRVLDLSAVVESGLIHWRLKLRRAAARSCRQESNKEQTRAEEEAEKNVLERMSKCVPTPLLDSVRGCLAVCRFHCQANFDICLCHFKQIAFVEKNSRRSAVLLSLN